MPEWDKIRGICQPCRDLLCADKPFDCEKAQTSPHWICETCHEGGNGSIVGDRVIKLSSCDFPIKPSKQEKAAFIAFASVYGKTARSSKGGHLAAAANQQKNKEIPEQPPEETKAVQKPSLIVRLKLPKQKALQSDNQSSAADLLGVEKPNEQWSTTVNRPPTPPESVAEGQESVATSNKTSPVESTFKKPSIDLSKLLTTKKGRKKLANRQQYVEQPRSSIDVEDDDFIAEATPRKRRRLFKGLREGEKLAQAEKDAEAKSIERVGEVLAEEVAKETAQTTSGQNVEQIYKGFAEKTTSSISEKAAEELLETSPQKDTEPVAREKSEETAEETTDKATEKATEKPASRSASETPVLKPRAKSAFQSNDSLIERFKNTAVRRNSEDQGLEISEIKPGKLDPKDPHFKERTTASASITSVEGHQSPRRDAVILHSTSSATEDLPPNDGSVNAKVTANEKAFLPAKSLSQSQSSYQTPVIILDDEDEEQATRGSVPEKSIPSPAEVRKVPIRTAEATIEPAKSSPTHGGPSSQQRNRDVPILRPPFQSYALPIAQLQYMSLMFQQEFKDMAKDRKLQYSLSQVSPESITWAEPTTLARPPTQEYVTRLQAEQSTPAFHPGFHQIRQGGEMLQTYPPIPMGTYPPFGYAPTQPGFGYPYAIHGHQHPSYAFNQTPKSTSPKQAALQPGFNTVQPVSNSQVLSSQIQAVQPSTALATEPQSSSAPQSRERPLDHQVANNAGPVSVLRKSPPENGTIVPSRGATAVEEPKPVAVYPASSESSIQIATNKAPRKQSFFADEYLFNMTKHSKSANNTSLTLKDNGSKGNALPPTTVVSQATAEQPLPKANIPDTIPSSTESIPSSLAFVAVNSNSSRQGSGFALKANQKQGPGVQQPVKASRKRGTRKTDYQLPNIAPKQPPNSVHEIKQPQSAPSSRSQVPSQIQKETPSPAAKPPTSKYAFLNRPKSQPPKVSPPPPVMVPQAKQMASGPSPILAGESKLSQLVPSSAPFEASTQPSLDHSDIFDRYPHGEAFEQQRVRKNSDSNFPELAGRQSAPSQTSPGSNNSTEQIVEQRPAQTQKRPLPSELTSTNNQYAKKVQRLSGPPPFYPPSSFRPTPTPLSTTQAAGPQSVPTSPSQAQFSNPYSQLNNAPSNFPPGFNPQHQTRTFSFPHPSQYPNSSQYPPQSQPQSPFSTSPPSIEATSIHIYIAATGARYISRLGTCNSAGEFINLILKKIGSAQAPKAHTLRVDFTWMAEGRDKSLDMRIADEDNEDSFQIVREEVGRRGKDSGEPARINVDVLGEGEGR